MDRDKITTRAGFVAVVGEPNVGKSTFLNAALGQKLSIVTRKPQTTRRQVSGILTNDVCQIIFLDTPGSIIPKYAFHEEMMKHVGIAIESSDVSLLIIDAKRHSYGMDIRSNRALQCIMKGGSLQGKQLVLGINKIDLIEQADAQRIVDECFGTGMFADIIPFSALVNENVKRVIDVVSGLLPLSPFLYDADDVSTQSERFFIGELVREKIYERYSDEMPYAAEAVVDEFKDRKGAKTLIRVSIIVERASQKAIIIGSGGHAIKHLGSACRKEIQAFLQKEIYLDLFVKVRKDWRKNSHLIKSFGY